ncbi:protein mono-ADP-ribosyltransferase TIPARP-like [Ptychodera flava]|uniref:protein mono-ADP-ribosyltransferase TIPARP-like n=1 Tax=Ptychodera flava TaxID=63121 RepID=UPI00396A0AB2
MPPGKEFIRFLLNRSSAEFRYVERVFRKSVQQENAKINAIERIQNPHIWDKYQRQKRYMLQKNGDIGLQVNLFHGTDEQSVPKICRQNFDFRVAGKNATLFGHGTYFARDASYSDCYSSDDDHGQRHMFLAYVLVGRYTVGQRSYKRPPEINTLTGELYDSCVNRQNDPTVFVIFDREQCYPAYLINFTKLNENRGPPFAANQLRSQVSTAAPPQHTAVTHNLSSGLNTDRWIPHTVSSTSTANLASPTTYVTSSSTRPNLSSPSSQYKTNSRSTSTPSRSNAISTVNQIFIPGLLFRQIKLILHHLQTRREQ